MHPFAMHHDMVIRYSERQVAVFVGGPLACMV